MSLDDVRQPKPVTLIAEGEQVDIDYWKRLIVSLASGQGADCDTYDGNKITIYPRAVND